MRNGPSSFIGLQCHWQWNTCCELKHVHVPLYHHNFYKNADLHILIQRITDHAENHLISLGQWMSKLQKPLSSRVINYSNLTKLVFVPTMVGSRNDWTHAYHSSSYEKGSKLSASPMSPWRENESEWKIMWG